MKNPFRRKRKSPMPLLAKFPASWVTLLFAYRDKTTGQYRNVVDHFDSELEAGYFLERARPELMEGFKGAYREIQGFMNGLSLPETATRPFDGPSMPAPTQTTSEGLEDGHWPLPAFRIPEGLDAPPMDPAALPPGGMAGEDELEGVYNRTIQERADKLQAADGPHTAHPRTRQEAAIRRAAEQLEKYGGRPLTLGPDANLELRLKEALEHQKELSDHLRKEGDELEAENAELRKVEVGGPGKDATPLFVVLSRANPEAGLEFAGGFSIQKEAKDSARYLAHELPITATVYVRVSHYPKVEK